MKLRIFSLLIFVAIIKVVNAGIVPAHNRATPLMGTVNQALPAISYASPQVYAAGTSIAPLSPSSTGGAVGAYATPTTLFSVGSHSAITVDGSGNIVAVNSGNNTLTTYNSSGTVITSNYPTSGYNGAQADIIDGAGNLYVSNYSANTVTKTTLGGVVTTISINTPVGLTVDASNNVYVVSQSPGTICKIAAGTAALSTFLTGFNQAWGVAINSTGDLYVSQTSDNTIYKISNGSTVHTSFATGFNSPRFLVLDPSGNLYVSDCYNSVMKQITPAGAVSTFISGLNKPDDEVFDQSGNFYISNFNTNSVLKSVASGYSVSPALPAGLYFNNYSGVIYGTPTIISAATTYTVTATNASGSATATVNITVTPAAPTATGGSVCGSGTVTLTASGGSPTGGTYNWYAASSGGTALQSSTATTYTTPSISTTTTYYVSYTASSVESSRTAVTATVNPLPVISYTTPPTYTVGTAITNLSPTVSGGTPTGYSVSPSLPAGLSLSTTTGTISGTPTAVAAAANYTVTATTAAGCTGTAVINITVNPRPPAFSYATPQVYSINTAITALSPTVTGGGVGSYGAVSTFETVNNTDGNTTDAAGNVYTTSKIDNAVYIYNSAGTLIYTQNSSDGYTGALAYNNPAGIIVDAAGSTYVTNRNTGNIIKTTTSNVITAITGFDEPTALAMDASGNIYVVDRGGRTLNGAGSIYKITTTSTTAGTAYISGLSYPWGIAVNSTGDLFISEPGLSNSINTIFKAASGSTTTTTFVAASAGLNSPRDMVFDAAGNLYEADAGTNTINMISPAGAVTNILTISGNPSPIAVSFDNSGNMYISGYNYNALYKSVASGYSISPSLPAGLNFNAFNGTVSGKPTATAAAANYTVTATNVSGSSTSVVNIAVNPVAPSVAVSGNPGCGSGSVTFTASAGSPSGGVYNWYSSPAGSIVATSTTFSPITSGTYYVSYVSGGTTSAQTSAPAVINPIVSSPYSGAAFSYSFSGNINDVSGNANNGLATGSPALTADRFGAANSAYNFNGSSQYISSTASVNNPNVFTLSLWFNTTTAGGKLLGFGNSQTGASGSYDRHIYMSNSGQLYYGIYQSNNIYVINTTASYNDGNWHHVIVTMGPDGSTLYVDGTVQATNASMTAGSNFTGYWRIGYDSFGTAWVNYPTNAYFTGKLDDIAVYNTELTAAQIASSNNLNQVGALATVCAGSPIIFNAPTITGATYTWHDSGSGSQTGQNPTFPSALAGNYTLTITGGPGGCSSTATITPTINAVPVIAYTTPQTYTVGTAITSLSPTSTGAAPTGYSVSPALPAGLSLSTTTGVISGTATVAAAATNYVVTATTASGCTGMATVNITVQPAAPTTTGGSTCGPGTVTLTASGGNPSGGTYNWYAASSGGTALQSSSATTYTTPSISATTTYYVSYTSSTVESTRTAVTATVNPLPVISYATPQTYTIGTAITSLSPTVSGGTPVSYSVSPALPAGLSLSTTTGGISGTPTAVSVAANYAVTATTASGCTGNATINIAVNPTAPAVAVSGSPGCGSGSVTFTASAGSPSGGVYNWYSSTAGSIVATGTTFSPITSGTYYVSYVSGGTTSAQTSAAAVINPVVSSPYSGAAFSYSFSGNTNDVSGNANNGLATGAPALTTDRFGTANSAYNFNGSSQYISSTALVNNPNVFTLSLWFNTTTAGGKLIGFGSAQTGSSGSDDRHIYMSNSGQLYFGIFPGSIRTINTTGRYNDGAWHHVVVTMGSDGSTLYVDGTMQASNAAMTTGQNFNGYWRIGYDNINTWTNQPSDFYFTGKLDDIAVYNTELSAAQIASSNNLNQAGALSAVCAGSPITFNSPTITGATYTWHDSGSGTQTGQNPTFPSAVAGNYTLTVTGGPGGCSSTSTISPIINAVPVISYATPQTYTVGTAITSLSPTSTGAAPTGYSVSPALPAGLSLSTTMGTISGTATLASAATNYTVTATTAAGCTGMTTVNITVKPAAPTATGGSTCGPGTVTLTASGGNPSGGTYNWYAASSGGTALQSSTATTYTTPSISTTTTYYVSYTSSSVESTRTAVTATVNPLPVIAYATPQNYTVGTAIASLSPSVSGGTPTSYSVSPALPVGLSLSAATGTFSGTATVAAAAANYTVTATTAAGCTGMTTVNITVTPPAPTATGGSTCGPGTANLTASNGNPTGGTYNWYAASSGGTALQSSTATTYTTPSISTTTTYYVSYTSSSVESVRTGATATVNPVPVISYATPQTYTAGTAIASLSPTVSGGTPVSYSVSPALPAGLSLSTTTGVISGTATVAGAAANYVVTATTASGCTGMATVNITVQPAAPTTTGGSTCGPGTVTLTAAGGNPSGGTYNWYAASSGGTALQSSTATTYTTPSITSTTTYYVSYTSSSVESARTPVTATVNPLPVINYTTPQTYTVGTAITALSPTASGGTPTSYSISPALPAGLSLSTTTGTISGTATVVAAAANYTVTATTASGCTGVTVINITVNPSAPSVAVSGSPGCGSGSVTFTASAGSPSGGVYNWYSSSTGGIVATGTTFSPITSGTYYVSYVSGGITSAQTSAVAVISPVVSSPYSGAVISYPFSGNTNDVSGNGNNGVATGSPTLTTDRFGAAGNAYSFNGSSQYISSAASVSNPNIFTLSLWFNTTTAGGKLIGFGSSQTGASGNNDRNIYMNNSGQLYYGIYQSGTVYTINTSASYNDGNWHHVVVTMGTDGSTLYVDGTVQATNASMTTGQNYTGYWRIGYDNLNGWTSNPSDWYFTGKLDDIAIYNRELSSAEIASSNNLNQVGYTSSGCAGNPITFTAPYIAGATYSWTDGTTTVTGQNATFASLGTGNYTLTVTGPGGCSSTASITPAIPTYTWTGSASTDPTNNNNWTYTTGGLANTLPPFDGTASLVIPNGLTNYPVLTANESIFNLTIASGAQFSLGGYTLNVGCNIYNSSTVSGGGILYGSSNSSGITWNGTLPNQSYNGTTTAGTGQTGNMTVNNSAGGTVTIAGGGLDVYNTLTMTKGNLVVGASPAALTLKSSAAQSASVAMVPAGSTITGNVTVERFVTGGTAKDPTTGRWTYRSYRLMSSPVNEGTDGSGNHPYSLNYLNASTIITGTTSTYGTTPGNPSLYVYNEGRTPSNATFTSGTFDGVTNISSTTAAGTISTTDPAYPTGKLYAGDGFMMYFRGDNINSLSGVPSKTKTPFVAPENVVFSTTGNLNQGTYSVTSWTGAAGLMYTTSNPGNVPVRGYNLVGNPYASSIDWSLFSNSNPGAAIYGVNVNPSIYLLNPRTSNYDVYSATTGVSTGNASNVIPSGAGFYVQANNSSPTLTFTEAAKTSAQVTGNNLLMGRPNSQTAYNSYMRMKLVTDTVNYDDIVIGFNSSSTTKFNPAEDSKFLNGGSAVGTLASITSDSVKATVKWLPLPKANEQRVIPLNVTALTSGIHTLARTDLKQLPEIYEVWLMDKYKSDSLDIKHNSTYAFNLDLTDTASYGSNRFKVVIRQDPALVIHLLNFTAAKASNGAQLVWKTENEQNYTNFTVERSTDNGKRFQVLGGLSSTGQGTYSFLDKDPQIAVDQYRLEIQDLDGTISYSKVIPLMYSSLSNSIASSGITIYPNPATSNVNLYIVNTAATSNNNNVSYNITVVNSTGTVIKTAVSATPTWQYNVGSLIPGTYMIQVVNNIDKSLVGKGKFIKL